MAGSRAGAIARPPFAGRGAASPPFALRRCLPQCPEPAPGAFGPGGKAGCRWGSDAKGRVVNVFVFLGGSVLRQVTEVHCRLLKEGVSRACAVREEKKS